MLKAKITPVTPFQQNCSLLWCDETMQGAFVDPGGDLDRLKAVVRETGVTIVKILITHGHADHAGGTAEIAAFYDVPVIGPHVDDKFWIDDIPKSAAQYGISGARAFEPDQWLTGGENITIGNLELAVFHTPGHTPGHVVFFEAGNRIAFVGDVLFQGSIGRTDFPRGNHDDLLNSIRTQLWPLGNDVTFVPGHGPLSTFGKERQSNPFVGDSCFS